MLGENIAPPTERSYSEETAREIDCAVRDIIADAFARTIDIVDARRAILEEGAAQLLAVETLDEDALSELRKKVDPA